MAEDDATGLVAGLVLDHLGDDIADPSEADMAEGVGLGRDGGRPFVGELGPFGDDDDVVVLAGVPSSFEDVNDVGDVDGNLGNQDVVRGGRDAGRSRRSSRHGGPSSRRR